MVSLSEIVLRLRAECAAFQPDPSSPGRVSGASAFEHAWESAADYPVPHCFVIPLYGQDITEFTYPNTKDGRQVVRQYFATIVCIDNSLKRGDPTRGAGDLSELDAIALIQDQLSKAFQGWQPIQLFNPIRFYRDIHLGTSNKRLWHQFEWYLSYEFDPTTSLATSEAVAAIIQGMDDQVAYGDSLLSKLTQIYVTYHTDDGVGADTPIQPPSWDDFWGGQFSPPPATSDEVTAKRNAANDIIAVTPHDADPTEAQIRGAETFQETPLKPPGAPHGLSTDEVTFLDL